MDDILKELEAAAELLEQINVCAIADCRRKVAIMGSIAKAHMFIKENAKKENGAGETEDRKE